MPALDDLPNRNYYITVSANNGSTIILSRRRISFSSEDFGFLLIKTSKPIYKPSQDGEWTGVAAVELLIIFSFGSKEKLDSSGLLLELGKISGITIRRI